jgi:hypothetical protein
MCPHTAIYVSSFCYMCPHTAVCVLILLYVSSYCYMCPHTAIYVSSYCYMCPHTALFLASSYWYICRLCGGARRLLPSGGAGAIIRSQVAPRTLLPCLAASCQARARSARGVAVAGRKLQSPQTATDAREWHTSSRAKGGGRWGGGRWGGGGRCSRCRPSLWSYDTLCGGKVR